MKAKLKALNPKDFPTQPIEFVVVYNVGGGVDLTARVLGKYVEKYIDKGRGADACHFEWQVDSMRAVQPCGWFFCCENRCIDKG